MSGSNEVCFAIPVQLLKASAKRRHFFNCDQRITIIFVILSLQRHMLRPVAGVDHSNKQSFQWDPHRYQRFHGNRYKLKLFSRVYLHYIKGKYERKPLAWSGCFEFNPYTHAFKDQSYLMQQTNSLFKDLHILGLHMSVRKHQADRANCKQACRSTIFKWAHEL